MQQRWLQRCLRERTVRGSSSDSATNASHPSYKSLLSHSFFISSRSKVFLISQRLRWLETGEETLPPDSLAALVSDWGVDWLTDCPTDLRVEDLVTSPESKWRRVYGWVVPLVTPFWYPFFLQRVFLMFSSPLYFFFTLFSVYFSSSFSSSFLSSNSCLLIFSIFFPLIQCLYFPCVYRFFLSPPSPPPPIFCLILRFTSLLFSFSFPSVSCSSSSSSSLTLPSSFLLSFLVFCLFHLSWGFTEVK